MKWGNISPFLSSTVQVADTAHAPYHPSHISAEFKSCGIIHLGSENEIAAILHAPQCVFQLPQNIARYLGITTEALKLRHAHLLFGNSLLGVGHLPARLKRLVTFARHHSLSCGLAPVAARNFSLFGGCLFFMEQRTRRGTPTWGLQAIVCYA
jgi:hypothetical protein